MPATDIHIQVHESDQANGENEGTFTRPHAKLRISKGANVTFGLLNAEGARFHVRFSGFQSPFTSGDLDITVANADQTVSQTSARYHYAIQVTRGGKTWSIDHCPELDVG